VLTPPVLLRPRFRQRDCASVACDAEWQSGSHWLLASDFCLL